MRGIIFTAPWLNCLTWDKCNAELASYVLNRIPPKYVDTEKGALYTKANHMSADFDMKILLEIAHASSTIGKAKGHD